MTGDLPAGRENRRQLSNHMPCCPASLGLRIKAVYLDRELCDSSCPWPLDVHNYGRVMLIYLASMEWASPKSHSPSSLLGPS